MKADRGERSLTANGALQAIVLVVAIVAPFLIARHYRSASSFDADSEPSSLSLETEAEVVNATLPEMVSEGVRLDKTSAGPGNMFNYSYTIVDDDAAKSLAGDARKREELKAQLRERVCSSMPSLRAQGTIVTYSLKNNAGAPIADISINPGGC